MYVDQLFYVQWRWYFKCCWQFHWWKLTFYFQNVVSIFIGHTESLPWYSYTLPSIVLFSYARFVRKYWVFLECDVNCDKMPMCVVLCLEPQGTPPMKKPRKDDGHVVCCYEVWPSVFCMLLTFLFYVLCQSECIADGKFIFQWKYKTHLFQH